MMKKLSILLLLIPVMLFLPGNAKGQDYNINGDTIKVSPDAYPMLRFMGEVNDYQPLCDGYYKVSLSGDNTVIVKTTSARPTLPCALIINEGSGKSRREHHFWLVYDKNANPAELIHDYSSKEKIERRNDYLQKARAGAVNERQVAGTYAGGGQLQAPAAPTPPKDKKGILDFLKSKKSKKKGKDATTIQAPVVQVPKAQVERPIVNNNNPRAAQPALTPEEKLIEEIPAVDVDRRMKEKLARFNTTCEFLCAKRDVNSTIKLGMNELFNNDETRIVSSTNAKTHKVSSQKIRSYFSHLAQLNYRRVEMTQYGIQFVPRFHLGPDGKYHGTAVFMQDFKGYNGDNILSYIDNTKKYVDVIIEVFQVTKDGHLEDKFEIYFGNISTENTPMN